MSHTDDTDMDDYKSKWDGPERFSDRCSNCDHSRANHLAVGISQPVSGGDCRVQLCRKDAPKGHSNHVCKEVTCDCKWSRFRSN